MDNSKRTLAVTLVFLMIGAPLANAGVSNWGSSNNLNSNGSSTTVTAFEIPGNSTIMDGWLHVTDSYMATSTENGISWEGEDFSDGIAYGTFLNEDGHLTIIDDGTRSNISSFDVGDISVSMNSKYKYTPGWRHIYTLSSQNSVSECSSQNAQVLSHGFDNDFDVILDSMEVIETIYYCDTFSKQDTIQDLTIISEGDDYYAGNLSASGGGGENFSGTYEISSGITSISINNAGSGYSTADDITIGCQCEGYDANASITSVDGSGGIESIIVDDAGSGYTLDDNVLFSISGSGSGANLDAVLESTGVINTLEITNEGYNYTSIPTIIISDSSGSGASISPTLGAYFEYELDIDSLSGGNSNCEFGGFEVKSGLDYNGNRNLGTDEIQNTSYLCNIVKSWEATTFTGLNGTIYGNQQNMSYGVIPASASSGVVAIATMPGSPLPAGTDTSFVIPQVSIPFYDDIENYYLSFDHWYHVDSTASGGGDGAWVEYRIKDSETWNDWKYVAPDLGYPSTMSTDSPVPNGAPSEVAIPVFASDSYSGWVSSTFDIESLVNETSSDIQFRFHIWTHPDAENERPGWFIDNINFNNDGINYGAWHHGCYDPSGNLCSYSANAYGSLTRDIDLSGTNSTSKIEIDMEWDLEGVSNDNACVEISLDQSTWYDISSTNPSTSSDCAARSGAIPGTGYTADNGVTYTDQSGRLRTVSLDIPNSFYNQGTAYLRIVVNTNYYTNYGGAQDSKEGLTVDEIRIVDYNGSNLFFDDLETSTSMSHTSIGTAVDDWYHYVLLRGNQEIRMNFEDSTASAPSVSDAPGWARSQASSCSSDTCKWTLNKIGANSGPPSTTSFPYSYGVAFSGNYDGGITEAKLISPEYEIPANGNAFLMFDHWVAMEPNWDGGAVFIKVNGGSWQHFDPGNWYDSQVSYNYNNLYGYDTFSSQSSPSGGMKSMQASLLSYQGDTVKFKFSLGSDSYQEYGGWFIDNAGVKIANYGEPGDWISPSFSISEFNQFNVGMVDIDAIIPENTSVTASLIDYTTGLVIPGFSDVTFPISLSGIDSITHTQIKLQVHLSTSDMEATPSIKKISIGGKRFLNADTGGNGWEFSSGVEEINGLLNATTISGSLISDFIPSSRPIKAINIGGNLSNGVTVTVLNKFGSTLGQASKGGGVTFNTPQPGFGLSVSLPTNAWIDRLVISSIFAAPASNPVVDVLNDGSSEWSFLQGDSYGHYGWQSTFTSPTSDEFATSKTLYLDGINSQTVYFRIPADANVNSGVISISSDNDGFDGPVSLSIAGSSQSVQSSNDISYNVLNSAQISGIVLMNPSHTDSDSGRFWKEVPVEVDSNSPQVVKLSGLGVGYTIFENVSGLEGMISSYHEQVISENPNFDKVDIPVTLSADIGSISIDGSIIYDFLIKNRDFDVPNTLYPNGESVEIVTSHHHLYDNSELSEITLEGIASDGNVIMFKVENGADGLWGAGSEPVLFSQTSGSNKVTFDAYSSYIEEITASDGYVDITSHWIFDVSWNWDDVEDILWTSRANDNNGDTIWPAQAYSGKSGSQAVENDIQIDTFNIFDNENRLISNIYDNLLYPFPILEGSILNISGNVRFQDSSSNRPMASDFSVGLNISGNLIPLESGENGEFFGTVTTPSDYSLLSVSPIIISIGPNSGATGAQDVTGQPTPIDILVDTNPPLAGPIQVNTPIGLQFADGMVCDPTSPFRAYITVSEAEARGDSITLKYWRTGVDDLNGDGIATEGEYLSQTQSLTPGLTGQQQVQFSGIDVSALDNEPIHLYIEGTDWAGLSYQEGASGGSSGADNSWASVIIAVDEPTQFAGDSIGVGQGKNSAFDLNRKTSDNIDYYLLPDVLHVFSVQIDDINGLITLDNITVMLCGYGSNLGLFTYEPWSGVMWTPEGSMTTPIGFQTEKITDSVTKLELSFKLSWDFPWDDDTPNCKPRVTVDDNLITVAESQVLSALSWKLDNKITAIPSQVTDLTSPVSPSSSNILYLKQGDEFSVSGELFYAGSGEKLLSISDDTQARISIIYGTEERVSVSSVSPNGSFYGSLILPSRAPLDSTMSVSTDLINLPGVGMSVTNSEASVTVDSDSPSALFNQDLYPDSSFTIIGTDYMDDTLVTISILDEIGMKDGPLSVEWEFRRGGQKISGTTDSGEIPLSSSSDGVTVYQGRMDFSPLIDITFKVGDQIALWINSTDKAGNEIIGLGSELSPRVATLRVMEFLGQYTREITTPTKFPLTGDILTIVTYWENPGKIDGAFSIGLWERLDDGAWRPSVTTAISGDTELLLPSTSSSIIATFKYETWQEGQPLLVIVVNGDFENANGLNEEITGISVESPNQVQSGGSTVWLLMFGTIIVSVIGLIVFMMRGRGEDYYDDDDDDEYYDE